MGIKSFLIALLFIATVSYFIPVNNLKKNTAEKDLPLVVFEKPIMYTLDDKSVHRIIIADQAVKYEKRDEMFNANITLKNQDKSKDFNSENLKADLIIKKGDVYTLTDNVKYKRDNFIKVDTNELIYDDIKKIAKNSKPFESIYNTHFFKGTNLYLDINSDYITAKNAHFEIDVDKNLKGKK
jgi:lipopolysaccharide assembly outer membrane protein LptD (OstA)